MSFSVKLYVTTSDRNKLSKVLSSEISFDCILKEQSDVLHPVIRVSTSSNLSGYNYARIERYGRYYYIEKIETTPNGYWEITMTVDPLMTYKDYIERVSGTITRSETIFDAYLNDPNYNAESYRRYVTKKFPGSLDDDCFILMTVG